MKTFLSKILLFGEYSVIIGSEALALPYNLFSGQLSFAKDGVLKRDEVLYQFCRFLLNIKKENAASLPMDLMSFEFDISQGLYFDSTIPKGFGIGSSGALCAAIFSRYQSMEFNCDNDADNAKLLQLKNIFSTMEAFFHGKSSGLDPLVSYVNRPILVEQKNCLRQVSFQSEETSNGGFFLLNSGLPRSTGPFVELFQEKLKDNDFAGLCEKKLMVDTNHVISHFLKGDFQQVFKLFKEISKFQLQHFSAMIPESIAPVWKRGLDTFDADEAGSYYLKLCGAGGGGFFLGLTDDFTKCREKFSELKMRPLLRF